MPLRARRRRLRLLGLLALVLALGGITYGVHWLSYVPQLTIQEVTIEGASAVPQQLVKTFVETALDDGSYHFLSRSNVLLYPRTAIEKGVVAFFPGIRSAVVSHPAPLAPNIIVTVVERTPYAKWCDTAQICYKMDEDGFVFGYATSTEYVPFVSSYVFSGGLTDGESIGHSYASGHFAGIRALLSVLQQQVSITPVSVALAEGQDFEVQFVEGFSLKASFGADTSLLARNLKLALHSDVLAGKEAELEYIDLRFGNRVYYKLRGEDEQTAP